MYADEMLFTKSTLFFESQIQRVEINNEFFDTLNSRKKRFVFYGYFFCKRGFIIIFLVARR